MDQKLTENDLKLLHQIDKDWYLYRGRIYSTRDYYGKRDRIYYKDGRLWRDTWVHEEADPLKQAMLFTGPNPKILPSKLKCVSYDSANFHDYIDGR